jgi:hypothetical protein
MSSYLEYLIYCIPIPFIILAYRYKLRSKRLQCTGKIPDIVDARQRQTLFSLLAILSALIIIISQLQFFSDSI